MMASPRNRLGEPLIPANGISHCHGVTNVWSGPAETMRSVLVEPPTAVPCVGAAAAGPSCRTRLAAAPLAARAACGSSAVFARRLRRSGACRVAAVYNVHEATAGRTLLSPQGPCAVS